MMIRDVDIECLYDEHDGLWLVSLSLSALLLPQNLQLPQTNDRITTFRPSQAFLTLTTTNPTQPALASYYCLFCQRISIPPNFDIIIPNIRRENKSFLLARIRCCLLTCCLVSPP